MKTQLPQLLRQASYKIAVDSNSIYWSSKIKDLFGIVSELDKGVVGGPFILRQVYNVFKSIPPILIKDCGIHDLLIRSNMGENKPYYPNHGYYVKGLVGLNADIFHNPDKPKDFYDDHGYFLSRPDQTLIHEFGHGYDEAHGDLSQQPKWLKLSGWSKTYQDGLKRLVINDPGVPQVIGEWFYDPKICDSIKGGFTRFYAKRNPWDDWADTFAFYVAGMKRKIPESKKVYFDDLFKKYY